jgi:hypothetical protein
MMDERSVDPVGAGLVGRGGAMSEHEHAWPAGPSGWEELAGCKRCGITLLRQFRHSAQWVNRRVESAAFLDDCAVRRSVSIDYETPADGVALRRPDGTRVRVLPLAILRRKSLVRFDFRDYDDSALPLLGLRENQALTLAIVRAWAHGSIRDGRCGEPLGGEVEGFLDGLVAGDQTELRQAFERMWAAPSGTDLERLDSDLVFRVMIDRLADSFLLYHLDTGPPGERRVVTFSYDEPLTLRHYPPSYRRDAKDLPKEHAEKEPLRPYSLASLRAALALSPTRIEFPIPAAELAASFHFQISAPPELSIIGAALLAGRPSLPTLSGTQQPVRASLVGEGRHLRPSFDQIGGGYPNVDLHVVEVPYGSRCHVQVAVEARTDSWFASAVLGSWLAVLVLFFAWLVKPDFDAGSALIMSFVAGLVANLARPNTHRLVARLLSKVRLLAGVVGVVTFVAAVLVAFASSPTAHRCLGWLLGLAAAGTLTVTASWLSAFRRHRREVPKESPWEHHRPRRGDLGRGSDVMAPHELLAHKIEEATHPYDLAFEKLEFNRPAVRVASCEGGRNEFAWDNDFAEQFDSRLLRQHQAALDEAGEPVTA